MNDPLEFGRSIKTTRNKNAGGGFDLFPKRLPLSKESTFNRTRTLDMQSMTPQARRRRSLEKQFAQMQQDDSFYVSVDMP